MNGAIFSVILFAIHGRQPEYLRGRRGMGMGEKGRVADSGDDCSTICGAYNGLSFPHSAFPRSSSPLPCTGDGFCPLFLFFARLRDDAIEATASDTYRLAMTGNTTLTAPRPHVHHVSTQHNTIAKRLAYSCNWIKRSTSADLS